MILLLLALAGVAQAQEPPEGSVHGDVKSFFFGIFPYESDFMPDHPLATAVLDARLKLQGRVGPVQGVVHHNVSALTGSSGGVDLPISSGVVQTVPEAIPLTWTGFENDDFTLRGRTDRLSLAAHGGPIQVTVGRQPFSFGNGLLFTPLDLVGPFNPAVVDQEYKPGYDAIRVDGFWGLGGQATVASVWASQDYLYDTEWTLEDFILVAYAQNTFGVTDIGLFYSSVLGDQVFGATVASGVGPVGLRADGALTLSDADGTFGRVTLGADWYASGKTVLSAELYLQSLGASDPSGYIAFAQNPRLARGELWLLGQWYGGLALSQEITPLIRGSLAVISNFADPSAFASVSMSWSVAGNAEIGLGAFLGLGKHPDRFTVRSEFGLYPATAFLQSKAYF